MIEAFVGSAEDGEVIQQTFMVDKAVWEEWGTRGPEIYGHLGPANMVFLLLMFDKLRRVDE